MNQCISNEGILKRQGFIVILVIGADERGLHRSLAFGIVHSIELAIVGLRSVMAHHRIVAGLVGGLERVASFRQ